jgi:3-methyladenine DNA glycosylase AlkD
MTMLERIRYTLRRKIVFQKIIADYRLHANPTQALPMAKYMKNQFPFLGIKRPVRDQLQKPFLQAIKKEPQVNWRFVDECWNLPEREYQYLTIDYLVALHSRLGSGDAVHIENLLVEKSWWDTVDIIAVKLLGSLCSRYPDIISQYILPWGHSENLWLVRSAILFQLKYKGKTDCQLLAQIIKLNNASSEFFINKAIGWALREYSKTDPEWVDTFLRNTVLQPLSSREASRYLESGRK